MIRADFVGSGNYAASSGNGNLTVTKAATTALVTLAAGPFTYTGSAIKPATVSVTGPGNLSLTPDAVYANNVNAGTATASYSYAGDDNYLPSSDSEEFTIDKATATLTLANLSHVYDGTEKFATVTTSPANLTGVSISNNGKTAADSYEVVATLENANYTAAPVKGTLSIAKATLAIKAEDASKVYGEANPSLKPSIVSGAVEGESFTLSASTVADENSAVGSYAIVPSVSGTTIDNYTVAATSGTLTIGKRELTAKADNKSRTYGDDNPELTISYSGFVLGQNASALAKAPTATTEATRTSAVNDYAITVAGGEAANYSFKYQEGTLTIGKAELTVTAQNESRVYGDTNPGFTGTVAGAKNGETFTVGGTTAATATSSVGSYDIVPTVSGTTIGNYTVTPVNGKLSVTAREITVTADAGQTKVYGDDEPSAYTYSITSSSLVNSDKLSGRLNREAGENVNSYAITQGTLAATDNYNLLFVGSNFSITQRAIEVTADAKTKVYGDEDPAFTYRITKGNLVEDDALSGELSRATGENIGSYAIAKNSLGAGPNYDMTFVPANLEIMPRAITVNPKSNQSKVFGTSDPVLAYDNTELVKGDSFTGTLARAAGDNVGAYAISIGSLELSSNYTLNLVEGVQFEITPMPITASITASNKVYDGTDAAMATGSAKGVDNADVAVNVSEARFASAAAGNGKVVTATVSISDGNYSLTSTTAATTADITPKSISGEFAAADKVYDGNSDATVTDRSLIDFIENDKVSLVGGTATFADKNAGAGKTVTLVGAELAGDDRGNYNLTMVSTATADIEQKLASVTPSANTKVYGGAEPTLGGETAGFLDADKVTASYSREAGETVATYTISAILSPETALGNYDITYKTAEFEITPATITVVAADKSKVYGDANPAFTGLVAGIVREDAITVAYNTEATAASPVATYAIVPVLSGAVLNNYTVDATSGTLTVTHATLTVVVNNKTRKYNEDNPELDGVLSGVKNNDNITASYSTTAIKTSDVIAGGYPITATFYDPDEKLSNYKVTNTPGVLTIEQAQATTTLADLQKTYNRSAQGATVTTSPAGIDVTVTYDGSATVPIAAGSYAVVAALNNSNYSAANAIGTLVINQKEVIAKLANSGKTYDGTTAATGTTATLEGIISPDVVSATVSGAAFSAAAAGERTVTANVELAGADKANYKLASITPATAIIAQKALTASISAEDKVYDGGTAATVSASLEGVVGEDNVVVTPSSGAFADKHVGNGKSVTADIRISGTDAGNYSVSASAATTASITARPITVVADAKSKVYGDIDPALTFTITSGELVQGEDFSGILVREPGDNVGKYAIQQNTLTAGSNYALTFTGADLVITKAPLTVTAHNASRLCGQQNDTFTGTITGIKRSDIITATYSSDADASSPAGTYAIVPALLGANLGNYEVTLVSGVLTIGSVKVDASSNSTPQAVKSTATTVVIKVTNATGSAAANVPVKLYFDNKAVQEVASNESGVASFNVGILQTGVYKIRTEAGAGCNETTVYLPVYDPNGGFVTGGGWIDSPAGAYKADKGLTGKAHFGFVAKYKKGSTVPDGNTEFQFQAGNLNFNSTAYDDMRLVIAGAKANYKGTGKINGAGNYGFMVSAVDGQANGGGGVDKFRIKIWDRDNGDAVVYDNNVLNADESAEPATALGGGSIVIHEAKSVATAPKSSKVISEELVTASTARFDNYPNAFSDRTTIRFSLDTEENFALEVYDIRGALVKKVSNGVAEAGKVYEFELDARNMAEGVYFARLATGSRMQTIKMLLKK